MSTILHVQALSVLDRLAGLGIKPRGITADSRAVQPGEVFAAFPGARVDGRRRTARPQPLSALPGRAPRRPRPCVFA